MRTAREQANALTGAVSGSPRQLRRSREGPGTRQRPDASKALDCRTTLTRPRNLRRSWVASVAAGECANDARVDWVLHCCLRGGEAAEPRCALRRSDPPRQPAAPASRPTRQPLKLRIGDVRKYMMPNEFRGRLARPTPTRTPWSSRASAHARAAEIRCSRCRRAWCADSGAAQHPTRAWRMFAARSRCASRRCRRDVVPDARIPLGPVARRRSR